jgi:CRP-like cAMP-binding protein
VAVLHAEDNASFGELALLDDDRRSATIMARKDCEVLALKREDFERFGDARPDIALIITRGLARLVTRNLRNSNEDVVLLFNALVNEVRSQQAG